MAPSSLSAATLTGVDRVRHQLLTALHIGKLTPGDKVPSVRRLADQIGMNRKTVHRAYRRLATEGLLDLRPGSGTFIAETSAGGPERAPIGELVVAANRCRAAASGLGLAPEAFASFLRIYLGAGLRDLPLAVAECNREQLHLIEQKLRTSLGVAPRPVLLSELASAPRQALRHCFGIVTTDCHLAEVRGLVAPLGTRVYRVALDPSFLQRLVEHARQGPVIMVLRDTSFVPVFLRLLRQMAVSPELIRRFRMAEPHQVRAMADQITEPASIYVSPLVTGAEELCTGGRFRRLKLRWRVEQTSLERLKASLALDFAAGPMRGGQNAAEALGQPRQLRRIAIKPSLEEPAGS